MSENKKIFQTPKELEQELKTIFYEMHQLLEKSKASPSMENSKALAEYFQKIDDLQKQINQQIKDIHSEK